MTENITGSGAYAINTGVVAVNNRTFGGSIVYTASMTTGGISVTTSAIPGSPVHTGYLAGGISINSASKLTSAATGVALERPDLLGRDHQ